MGVSENGGFSPQIIQFNRDFHYKSSILGYMVGLQMWVVLRERAIILFLFDDRLPPVGWCCLILKDLTRWSFQVTNDQLDLDI